MIINTDEWLSLSRAKDLVKRTKQTICNWRHENLVKTIKVGKVNFYSKEDLLAALEQKKRKWIKF